MECKKSELFSDDIIGDARKSLQDWVKEAYKHAIAEGIDANTIVLNKNFVKTNDFGFLVGGQFYHDMPPMILGLEIRVTDDLPDKVDFALIDAPFTERERLISETTERVRKETIAEFAESLKKYYNSLGGETFGTLVAYTIDKQAEQMIDQRE